jgi:hypothetical protein
LAIVVAVLGESEYILGGGNVQNVGQTVRIGEYGLGHVEILGFFVHFFQKSVDESGR